MATTSPSTSFWAGCQPQLNRFVHEISGTLQAFLNGDSLNSIVSNFLGERTMCRAFSAMGHITPMGLTSFLVGVASTLMFLGSVIFIMGVMLMPLVALIGTFTWAASLLPSYALPPMVARSFSMADREG